MIEPLTSVIIPTYKRAAFIRRAVENVLRQTYRNIEILVVDDGSPDETSAVVNAIADPRVRLIRQPINRGVSVARNSGIRAARGALIGFMDDDDEWREDKLEKQVRAIEDYDAILCMGVANGCPFQLHKRPDISLEDLRESTFNPSGLLVKAYVLRDILFDENLQQGEDWDIFIRIRQRYSIAWLGEPLLFYNEGDHERATNRAKHMSPQELEQRAQMLHKQREFFGERWYKQHLADAFLAYIGNRPNKVQFISYAVRRCGVVSVLCAMFSKVRRRFQRLIWTVARS